MRIKLANLADRMFVILASIFSIYIVTTIIELFQQGVRHVQEE